MLALAPWLVAAAYHWADGPGPAIADYAQYLGHARALADGRPYSDTGYIFTGLYPYAGPPAQPPGLPLMLAVLFKVFGESLVVVRLAMLAATATFLVLAGRYIAAHVNYHVGLAATLLVGLSPEMARLSAVPLSDLPFAALIWAMVLSYDRPGSFGAGRVAAVTLLGVAAVSVRTFGVALAPAVVLFWALNRRTLGLRPVIPVFVWSACFLVANLVLPITVGFRPTMRWLEVLPRTIVAHASTYRYSLFTAHLYPFPWDLANDVYHVAAALIALGGLALWAARSWRSFAALFSLTYVVMLHVVPVLDHRYMWPMHPLLVMALILGLLEIGRRAGVAAPGRMVAGLAAVLALLAMLAELRTPKEPSFASRPEVRELFGALKDTHRSTPVRAAFVRPQILALEAGVPGMTIFDAPDSTVLGELDRKCITHVVLGDLGLAAKADLAFRNAVAAHPASFALEFRNAAFSVYRNVGLACARTGPRRPADGT